jgi:hypothetical protein
VPALQQAPDLAIRHRLVRPVFTSGPATESGCGLRRLRPGYPALRRWAVPTLLGTLAAQDHHSSD